MLRRCNDLLSHYPSRPFSVQLHSLMRTYQSGSGMLEDDSILNLEPGEDWWWIVGLQIVVSDRRWSGTGGIGAKWILYLDLRGGRKRKPHRRD